ncbi:hypothetical protein NS365_13400 [Aureimonas ureilytica]|uniref:Uncharacterized protein n=1 Tax=Aureimonas ureilytica TaxID=401562 RepID=A0A175RN02_9HYPH|nr:hypothetical protein NS365_13400 [Aureimonas ureilytica]
MIDLSNTVSPQLELPPASDDWSADNRAGHCYADRIVGAMREKEAPIYLAQVVENLIAASRYDGVTVGFFHRIAEYAIGAHRV